MATESIQTIISHCADCGREIDLLLDRSPMTTVLPDGRWRIELSAKPRLCPPCLVNASSADRRPEIEGRIHWWTLAWKRATAGIPFAGTVWEIGLAGMPKPFTMAALGVAVTDWPEDSPIMHIGVRPPTSQRFATLFALPVVHVMAGKISGALEARWSLSDVKDGQARLEVIGWQTVNRMSDMKRLIEGTELIREYHKANLGRPPGTGQYPNAESFHAKRTAVLAEMKRENIKADVDQISYRMDISERRYYELMDDWPLPE